MVFSSLTFIFFLLPCFLLLDRITRTLASTYLRNIVLLFISLVFYTFGDVFNLPLLVFLGIENYIAGNIIYKYKRKSFLVLFIFINISILFYCKYAFWLLELLTGYKTVTPPPPSRYKLFYISCNQLSCRYLA